MADGIHFSLEGGANGGLYRAAFERAPEVMLRHMSAGAEQGAQVVAAAARLGVKRDIFATLRNSIHVARLGGLPPDAVGSEARTAVGYARYVEDGTGPAAGRPRYFPNPDSLLQYLTHSRSTRGFKWAGKAGSAARGGQEAQLRDQAFAWARSIWLKGTRAHPYMGPAVSRSGARVLQVLRQAAQRGVAEVFGAG